MHPQLEILLQLQDLKSQRRELRDADAEREFEAQEFQLNLDEAIAQRSEKIDDLEGELTPQIRGRYERVKKARGRAVVPVVNGTCYGCFVTVATSSGSNQGSNDEVRSCEHCGRFLYVVG